MVNKQSGRSNCAKTKDSQHITRMHPSMKRPRAPIACFRCHHKKVRCDGTHPTCTRCLSTGVHCAYPSSRRSRNTQPTNVDPFIDSLSHLESRIRRIESDLETQRALMHSVCVGQPQQTSLKDEDATAPSDNALIKHEDDVAGPQRPRAAHSPDGGDAVAKKKPDQGNTLVRSIAARRGDAIHTSRDKRIQKPIAAVSSLAQQKSKSRANKYHLEPENQDDFPHFAAPNASDIYYMNHSHVSESYMYPYSPSATSSRSCPPSASASYAYSYDSLGAPFEWPSIAAVASHSPVGGSNMNQSPYSNVAAAVTAEEAARLADVQQNGIAPSLLSCQESAAGSRYPLAASQQHPSNLIRSGSHTSPLQGYYDTLSHFMTSEDEVYQGIPTTAPTLLYNQQLQ